jgi:hypothetical protein
MNNIATVRKASRRRGCRRNRRVNQMGGAGEAYTLGGHVAGAPIVNNYSQQIVGFPSCEGATRPGYIADASIKGGLPGFAGGGRRRRSHRRRSLKGGRGGVLETSAAQVANQMGGRYTFEPNVAGGVGMMEPRYSGCGDGAIQNPLNKGDVSSLITAPPAQVPTPTPMKGGRRGRKGTRKQHYGGVGGVDSMVYNAPRAGYSFWPSNAEGGNAGTLADGKTPFAINVPFSAQPVISQACLRTGGGRKSRRRRGSKKSRKGRKGTRRR